MQRGTSPTPLIEPLAHGLYAIDTRMAGISRVTAGYLIDAPRPTLIECGPARSVGNVIEALFSVGIGPGDLAYLVLSHIHLDHAGGAGDVATAFPSTTVIVSEIGARHLPNPERLNASSRRVYGDELMETVYGDCTPVESGRVRGVADGARLDLGAGRRLELLFTPGHAKHHIAAFDPDAGLLFVGDSVGVKLPGMAAIRPATPPPDFDLVLAQNTLDRYRKLNPSGLYLAHYGPIDVAPAEALDEASARLCAWAETTEAAMAEHSELDHVVETLAARLPNEVKPAALDDPEALRRIELLSGYQSNAMGLIRYFTLRAEGRTAATP
jgi:glyoxylase-like metal-dependent hydrolase (beta-lactamase superfamily II)